MPSTRPIPPARPTSEPVTTPASIRVIPTFGAMLLAMAAAGLLFVMMGTMAIVLMVGAGFCLAVFGLHWLLWGRWMGELSRRELLADEASDTITVTDARRIQE